LHGEFAPISSCCLLTVFSTLQCGFTYILLALQSPEFASQGIELVASEMNAVADGKGFLYISSILF